MSSAKIAVTINTRTAPWLSLIKQVFSFETFFVLFLFAGSFKAAPRFAKFPIDMTLFFLMLSLLTGLFVFTKRGNVRKSALVALLFYLLFSVWVAASLFWAPVTIYSQTKALRLLTLTLWSYAGAALVIANDPIRMRRFYSVIVLFSVWIAVEALLVYKSDISIEPRLDIVVGGNYLGVGRLISLGLIVLVITWLFIEARRWASKILLVSGIALFLGVIIAAGGRGPFISLAFTGLLAGVIVWRMSRVTMLVIVVLISVWLGTSIFPQTTISRLSVIVGQPYGGASVLERQIRYELALEMFLESPIIGQGIGSFYSVYGNSLNEKEYPHNIILEIMAELGLIGLFLLGIFIYKSVKRIRWIMLRHNPYLLLAVLFAVNTFANALVSGDVLDNRLLFTSLGLSVAVSSTIKAE